MVSPARLCCCETAFAWPANRSSKCSALSIASSAERIEYGRVTCNQCFLFAHGPSLQLPLPSYSAFQGDVTFGVNDSDGTSSRCIARGCAVVVACLAAQDIVGVADVQTGVSTSDDIDPMHWDDDAIVPCQREADYWRNALR